ncbi:MAG: endonuclease MutS2 [Oscillospiraceae bacterium]|jgi:DNA mismatch repair protein MutS2|nr:endonuclease MutS2 [Oscillospiraceae bacterium]
MTLFEKSAATLELPAVLRMLSDEAAGELAKANALNLQPATDIAEARYLLEETTAARTASAVRGSPEFSGVRDLRASVRRADIGGTLNPTELLGVASVLRAAEGAIAYANSDRSERTVLDDLFYALRSNRFLESKISGAIISAEEIADSASPALSDIRRKMRVAGDKIRTQLQKIISSTTYQKALQEPIITMRNDRYVVPVKADHKSSVPGLVHDISGSGSTLFIEPMSVVQTNNEIRELLAAEKTETDRILAELSADVAAHGEDLISDFETLTKLDLIFAKAKLSSKMNAHPPELEENGQIHLRRCRHPLLDRAATVPVDLVLGAAFDTLVITGPNTGGKTVALKTLGLFCAMAQCGLHIPAEYDSRLPVFERILADIGGEQSIEQSLSTFSSHMTNIVKILAELNEGGRMLLLFDELGAGTDPVEGAALAVAIIEYARARGALVAATTHYSELKTYALTRAGVENASCEFDVETLKPTYKLLIGVPGKSNAFAISKRLGLPQSVIDAANERVGTENRAFEDAVAKLESARRDAENDRDEAYRLREAAQRDSRIAEKYRSELEREREKAAVTAKRDATRLIESTRGELDAVFEELNELRRLAEDENNFRRLNEARAAIYGRLNDTDAALHMSAETAERPEPDAPNRPVAAGDRVKLLKYDTEADVISVSGNNLQLQAGAMKLSAKLGEVRLIERKKSKKPAVTVSLPMTEASVAREIDVRGQTADDALPVVERYIDAARRAKLETVTVIHGKGTGALRAAVHEMLRRDANVKSFRLGRFGEGEIGVTVVELK